MPSLFLPLLMNRASDFFLFLQHCDVDKYPFCRQETETKRGQNQTDLSSSQNNSEAGLGIES